jgi:hypothetical protein
MLGRMQALSVAAALGAAGASEWTPSADLRGASVPMPNERQLEFLDEELNQVSLRSGARRCPW